MNDLQKLKLIEDKIFVESCAVDNVSDTLRKLWRERDKLKESLEKGLTNERKIVR